MVDKDGLPKGLRAVLRERGLWGNGQDASGKPLDVKAMRAIMAAQPDFLAERPILQKMVEDAGHECIFLPK